MVSLEYLTTPPNLSKSFLAQATFTSGYMGLDFLISAQLQTGMYKVRNPPLRTSCNTSRICFDKGIKEHARQSYI